MSLEAKIELLTAAVVELTRVLLEPIAVTPITIVKPETNFTAEVAEVTGQYLAETVDVTPVEESAAQDAPANSVTYDDVKGVTIQVSKIDKAKAVAALQRFGVATAKALKEEQWADYVVYMTRVAVGEVDPETSHE